MILDTTVVDTTLMMPVLLNASRIHYWRVSASDTAGTSAFSAYFTFATGPDLGVPDEDGLPREFALGQNYPNPFNPKSQIKYAVPKQSRVTIKVYNTLGQEVTSLFDGIRAAGYYTAVFDGTKLASGVYFYRMRAGSFVQTRKLLLTK